MKISPELLKKVNRGVLTNSELREATRFFESLLEGLDCLGTEVTAARHHILHELGVLYRYKAARKVRN